MVWPMGFCRVLLSYYSNQNKALRHSAKSLKNVISQRGKMNLVPNKQLWSVEAYVRVTNYTPLYPQNKKLTSRCSQAGLVYPPRTGYRLPTASLGEIILSCKGNAGGGSVSRASSLWQAPNLSLSLNHFHCSEGAGHPGEILFRSNY